MRVLLFAMAAGAWAASPETLASFDKIWTTVRDRHWDAAKLAQVDGQRSWDDIRADYRARVEASADDRAATAIMAEMLGLLGASHYAILSGDASGDLIAASGGDGTTGIRPLLVGRQILVGWVEAGSPAALAGIRPGWEIVSVGSYNLQAAVAKALAQPKLRQKDLLLRMAATSRLSGPAGTSVRVGFRNSAGALVVRALMRAPSKGTRASFGFLPPSTVEFESRRVKPDIGYVRFNLFLDPANLMAKFEDAVKGCAKCRGFVIDLRGNPGGLAILGASMAGFFIDQPDTKLGTLYQRDLTLKLFVNPRLEAYAGPLAILVDGASVSTSEIMAGGLQDLKRARVFGTRTAGAALPSLVEQLPNGDLFQYAMANYISEGGRSLEGAGVTPDVEAAPTRAALLAGKDPALDAAVSWIYAHP